MNFNYNGHNARIIPCYNFKEAIEKIENGKMFRTNNLDFYYRLSKGRLSSSEQMPSQLYIMRTTCVTSVTTNFTKLVRIIKSENPSDKLYFGADLEKLILKELNLWSKTMNMEKLTGFGSKRFASYLNAIPFEILANKNFIKRAQKAIADGFKSRKLEDDDRAKFITNLATQRLKERYKKEKDRQLI